MSPIQSIDVLLRAINGRRFQQEMRAAGRSAQALGRDFGAAGRASSGLASAASAASGSLYAISAASRVAAFGIGALTLGVVGLGVQFNSVMEQNELSFKRFVSGGEAGTQQFVADLVNLARETPLQLEGIATAARRLFAVQIPESDILKTLQGMADMTSVTGASTDVLLRMSKALGDVHVKGRLMAEEVRQFSNLGVNWRQILDEGGMKLSQKNLENIGRAGISSTEFFKAWYVGVERVFGGASQEYLETFAGQWEKLKDNIKITAGFLTGSIFEGLKGQLKSANDALDPLVTRILDKDNPQAVDTLRKKLERIGTQAAKIIGAGIMFVVGVVRLFMDTIAPAEPFFANVLWPLLKGIFKGLAAGFVVAVALLKMFFQALGWIGKVLEPLKPAFETLGTVIAFLFAGPIMGAIGGLSKFGFLFGIVGTAVKVLTVPITIVSKVLGFLGRIAWGVIQIFARIPGIIGAIPRILVGVANRFVAFGGKIKDAVGGVITWIGTRLPATMKEKFYDAAIAAKNAFVRGIKGLGAAILKAITTVGVFALGIGKSITNWLNENTIFGDKINLGPLGSVKIPALAGGGYITGGGWAMVGERGPELVQLPRSASVIPSQPAKTRALRTQSMGEPSTITASTAGTSFDSPEPTIVTKVYLDRRQIAEAVGEHVAHKRARG